MTKRKIKPQSPTNSVKPLNINRFGKPRGRLSKLTLRILAINIFAVGILFVGVLYLDRYQNALIHTELETLSHQAALFSRTLSEVAIKPDLSNRNMLSSVMVSEMIRRSNSVLPTRARVFAGEGSLLVDSIALGRSGRVVQIRPLDPISSRYFGEQFITQIYKNIFNWLPQRSDLPIYRELARQRANQYPEVIQALRGSSSKTVRTTANGGLILTAAVPIQKYKQVFGALLLSLKGEKIDQAVQLVRLEILGLFGLVLAITVALSLYLASSIIRPIQRLATAAEKVRTGRDRQHSIPDFSERNDEIGDLARATREMTENLWQRMDAIERFAADVAHEIKNPLTSVRSAVETASRIDDTARREKLFKIIVDDVNRLDRLINDISEASRIDTQLSKEAINQIDIGRMLETMKNIYVSTDQIQNDQLICLINTDNEALTVYGNENRLVQVLQNLINNAITFSPDQGKIVLLAELIGPEVVISVTDEGKGIPDSKLETIFDRFYTERPKEEKFGIHSGLGLSICKQIVEAHYGKIWAENHYSEIGEIIGARFIFTLSREETNSSTGRNV